MLNINEVTICGCLGRDPDLRYGTNNLAFVSLAVATNRRVKNADGQYENVTDWNTVVAFGKTAETIAEYLHKGSPIWVRGRLQTRKYKDKKRRRPMGDGSHLRTLPVRPECEGPSTTATGRTGKTFTRARTSPDL